MHLRWLHPIVISIAALIVAALPLHTSEHGTEKIRGVCWVGGDSIVLHNVEELSRIHAGWISQTPFGWQPDFDKPQIRFAQSGWYWGERDEGIRHTTAMAKKAGIKSVLKPHLWLRRSGGKWRADIQMTTEDDWEEWFCNYTEFILHYARLAEECDIEILCIGTELFHPAIRYPQHWREIIAQIRSVFSGQLTYAANFHEEYERIEW